MNLRRRKGPLDKKFHLAPLSVPRTQAEFWVSGQTSDVRASLYSQKDWAPSLDYFDVDSGTSWSPTRLVWEMRGNSTVLFFTEDCHRARLKINKHTLGEKK